MTTVVSNQGGANTSTYGKDSVTGSGGFGGSPNGDITGYVGISSYANDILAIIPETNNSAIVLGICALSYFFCRRHHK